MALWDCGVFVHAEAMKLDRIQGREDEEGPGRDRRCTSGAGKGESPCTNARLAEAPTALRLRSLPEGAAVYWQIGSLLDPVNFEQPSLGPEPLYRNAAQLQSPCRDADNPIVAWDLMEKAPLREGKR